jgi:hypothetical protein
VKFEVIGEIEQVETIAAGPSVKVRSFLRKTSSGRATLVRGARDRETGLQNQGLLGQTMKRSAKQFALCLENRGNEASLILGKVYRILPDARAAKDDLVRIVDESGDDYLFDKTQFAFVEFPQAVRTKILALQRAS